NDRGIVERRERLLRGLCAARAHLRKQQGRTRTLQRASALDRALDLPDRSEIADQDRTDETLVFEPELAIDAALRVFEAGHLRIGGRVVARREHVDARNLELGRA